ncbi:plastocyanin [Chelonobacter oris]|uniref:OmpA family protein n=1 Tax=Chelonobacter oris TaxID=505317 RepID=UPI002449F343|nr:OmpA family protein [Chelonobacter oris]MDH3001479.1 plastocyanin [Chelonobacter oris]
MNTLIKYGLPVVIAMGLAGCRLSDVKADGTTDAPVWPKIEDAGVNFSGSQYGIWPNWDNVRMIEKGMNKDQLYYLIGRPHFSEGLFAVREWDYVFNYHQNGEHKICQYKVLFDKDMNVQSLFWNPVGCNNQFALSGDFLFDFDASGLTIQGKSALDGVISGLRTENVKAVEIAGYTDRLGSERYNQLLSQKRAEAVKAYFVEQGFTPSAVTAVGYGKADQVVACEAEQGQALRDCLRPNRRVVISAK